MIKGQVLVNLLLPPPHLVGPNDNHFNVVTENHSLLYN